jgi:hypothetical protein
MRIKPILGLHTGLTAIHPGRDTEDEDKEACDKEIRDGRVSRAWQAQGQGEQEGDKQEGKLSP